MSRADKFQKSARERWPGGEALLAGHNAVFMQGRVTCPPETRSLPSGTEIVSLRISVPRATTAMTRGSKQRIDVIDCVAWATKARGALLRCAPGDRIEVSGSLRRRFFRTGGGGGSRVEIEVLHVRKVG